MGEPRAEVWELMSPEGAPGQVLCSLIDVEFSRTSGGSVGTGFGVKVMAESCKWASVAIQARLKLLEQDGTTEGCTLGLQDEPAGPAVSTHMQEKKGGPTGGSGQKEQHSW